MFWQTIYHRSNLYKTFIRWFDRFYREFTYRESHCCVPKIRDISGTNFSFFFFSLLQKTATQILAAITLRAHRIRHILPTPNAQATVTVQHAILPKIRLILHLILDLILVLIIRFNNENSAAEKERKQKMRVNLESIETKN